MAASDFCLATIDANPLNCASNPIVGAGGGMIQLGYSIANGLPKSNIYRTQKSGVDNFNVDITSSVPEPGSFALAGLGAALIAFRRRLLQPLTKE